MRQVSCANQSRENWPGRVLVPAVSGESANVWGDDCCRALQKTDPTAAESFFERSIERFFDGDQLLHSRETFDYIVNYYVSKEKYVCQS